MRCATVREDLTALADGELAGGRSSAVRAHLEACSACTAEYRSIERTVGLERLSLAVDLPTLRLGFDTRLRALLAEVEAEPGAPQWRAWLWKPVLASLIAVAGILLAAIPLGGPSSVLVPLGVKAPPPKVAKQPELFRDYAIIEHLDELEHFDVVDTIPLEDELNGEAKDSG